MMFTFLQLLIAFFVVLVGHQVWLRFREKGVVEGLTTATTTTDKKYQPYNLENDPMILAKQNAGNIDFLKQRVDTLEGINQKVADLTVRVDTIQTQLNDVVTAQTEYSKQVTGANTPEISGATEGMPQDSSQLVT